MGIGGDDRILEGASPGELPIGPPSRNQRVTDLKTAKSIGVTIAPSLRLRANEIIQ